MTKERRRRRGEGPDWEVWLDGVRGRLLEIKRTYAGNSDRALARLAEVTPSTAQSWTDIGRRPGLPSLSNVWRLLEKTHTSAAWLVFGTGEPGGEERPILDVQGEGWFYEYIIRRAQDRLASSGRRQACHRVPNLAYGLELLDGVVESVSDAAAQLEDAEALKRYRAVERRLTRPKGSAADPAVRGRPSRGSKRKESTARRK